MGGPYARCIAMLALAAALAPAGWSLGDEAPRVSPHDRGDGLLAVGSRAPVFALRDTSGTPVRLEELLGRPLVLYFYPKDDTPGCTVEACSFRDDFPLFDSLGIGVVGISTDDAASHTAFAKKYRLPFPLLADEGGRVASLYGAAIEIGSGERRRVLARRVTYLIDVEGIIRHVFARVDPAAHSAEVLAVARAVLIAEAEDSRSR